MTTATATTQPATPDPVWSAVHANMPLAKHLLARMGHRPDHMMYDDLLTQCQVALERAVRRHDGQRARFGYYADLCMRRQVQHYMRRYGRPRSHVRPSNWDRLLTRRASSCDAQQTINAADLEALMAGVTDRQRQVLRMHFWEGKTFRQIGAAMGITMQAAWYLATAAIGRMRAAAGVEQ